MSIKSKRIVAGITDFYIVFFISLIFSFVILFKTWYPSFYQTLIFFAIMLILWILKDKTFRNASIGKKILKIEVIKSNETKFGILTSIKRNLLIILLPIEVLLIITDNKRLGDMWAKTIVVESTTCDVK